MIEYLKLTNFKRHENLEINFQCGLTLLAGPNEAGKSSVIHAILYALYGSRALPRSLDGTVTYDKPVNSLRVDLRIRVGGVPYTIYRSKSGAEMVGGGNRASGQSEVTAAVERLLGAPMAVAVKVLVANQKALQGVVDEGSAAVKLIEELAELDAIEVLVDKVEAQLLTGNTKVLSAQAAALAEAQPPVLPDLSAEIASATGEAATAEAASAALQLRAEAARTVLGAAQAAQREHKAWAGEVARLEAVLSKPRTVAPPFQPADIAALEAAAEAQKRDAAVRAAWDQWQALTPVADPGPQPLVGPARQDCARLRLELQATKLRRINEESCALCGKLLQDVPEVATGNAKVDAEVARLSAELASATEVFTAAERALDVWEVQVRKLQNYKMDCARLGAYVKDGVWVGPSVSSEVDTTDYTSLLRAEREKQRQADTLAERIRIEDSQAAAAQTQRAKLVEPPHPGDVNALEAKAAEVGVESTFAAAKARAAAKALAALTSQDAVNRATYAAECKAFEAGVKHRETLLATVAEMETHNALTKKLRTARPAIAAKLWAGLLGAIGSTFSTIRGVPSAVTRSADGFEVDGKPVADLSGSTLDALGLAVRVALLRAFLPGVGFLILDEPSAACDAEREASLLGTLVSLGLDQVLLVSHSEAAKAVAGDVVQL